jgi:hypothetical protein
MTIGRVGTAPAVSTKRTAAPSLASALKASARQADAMILKLDKNKDGFVNQAELKPLLDKLDKITRRMGEGGDVDPTSAAGKEALKNTRAKMSEADRLLMTIAQAATSAIDEGVEQVAVKAIQKGVRTTHLEWVKAVRQKDGGIMDAIGMMFAALLLPNDVLKAAIKK